MTDALDTLTDKEKETLRLIVRGHDAKSAACELDLSVHTINERLRVVRRKLSVTSSREAARLLLESEAGTPENLGYKPLGDAETGDSADQPGAGQYRPYLIGGLIIMLSLALTAALALSSHPPGQRPVGDPATRLETVQLNEFEAIARQWLALVDAGDWDASFAEAGRPFRDPNTAETWRSASEQVRVPLGAVLERKATTEEFVESQTPGAKPAQSVVLHFTTRFEHRSNAIEIVTLEQEHGEWRVMGYVIE